MNGMISYCGINCADCGALQATRANDDIRRKEVAEEWSKLFGADIKAEDINCEGCTSPGEIHFQHCSVCDIRQCASARNLKNCAYCEEYACDRLENFFKMVPDSKKRLDEIRSGL
ncbi:MAG: DUF3795 domain-containing protein [Candidatus Krumholzibacteriota bacterium]|nr:DUF3795 domain-containing protein [Candidatus Krumholzibacteriota bacterium]